MSDKHPKNPKGEKKTHRQKEMREELNEEACPNKRPAKKTNWGKTTELGRILGQTPPNASVAQIKASGRSAPSRAIAGTRFILP